jgi:aldehyde dehydrogenase (NAD+)
MAQLRRLLDAMTEHETALLAALHADLRKSQQQAFATEVGFVMGEIRHAMRHLDAWMRPEKRSTPLFLWPAGAAVHPEPLGVALIIGPWNYPLQLLLGPLLGAIAAGNCAVLKPSEFAPHTAQAIAEMVQSAFDPDYVTVVQGERPVAEALLREKFDTLFFTGSTAVGRVVMEAAARHLTPVTLELGGRSPCIVCADAPLEITARRIAWGKFMNAGQTCVAPDHVWVERSVAAPLAEALKKALLEFYGPDPQQSADYGRIIHRRHFDRLAAFLSDGKILAGGRTNPADLYIQPTLLSEVSPGAAVLDEEIFGPILPLLEFDDLDAVLDDLHRQPSPLALYLFTRDRAVQQRVLAETRSGGVCINDTISHILGKDLPFGGLGESGMGSYHGKASFDAFSHRRTVLRRSFLSDPKFRYPPGDLSWPTFKRLLRWFGNG